MEVDDADDKTILLIISVKKFFKIYSIKLIRDGYWYIFEIFLTLDYYQSFYFFYIILIL